MVVVPDLAAVSWSGVRGHLSSDPEWKYVYVGRYSMHLEESIARGTQWAVFEPNDEPLGARIRSKATSSA
jgi:phage tail sheath protein FI